MINYIFVNFIPGSAGNFFTRCLNLVDDSWYCWMDSQNKIINLSLDEKLDLFSYHDTTKYDHWIKFEKKICFYHHFHTHHDLPDQSTSIWLNHPNYDFKNNDLVGHDDKQQVVYIDPSQNFEWVILNALYKNSYIDRQWLEIGHQMELDPDVYKVPIESIRQSPESLLNEVGSIAQRFGKYVAVKNQDAIVKLWHQWKTTCLEPDRFQEFKKQIGFYI